jgi:hypothetical protein
MRGGRSRLVAFACLAALAVLLGGCELLLGPAFGPDDGRGFGPDPSFDFEDPFPSSSPIGTYAHGSATIRIAGGETIELTRFYADATADANFGANAHWSGPDGWHLRISGAGSDESYGGGYVVFDRVRGGEHWTSLDEVDHCDLDVTVMTADALRGTATCTGVRWFDELDMSDDPDGPKPLDEPAFDAKVTFEATR